MKRYDVTEYKAVARLWNAWIAYAFRLREFVLHSSILNSNVNLNEENLWDCFHWEKKKAFTQVRRRIISTAPLQVSDWGSKERIQESNLSIIPIRGRPLLYNKFVCIHPSITTSNWNLNHPFHRKVETTQTQQHREFVNMVETLLLLRAQWPTNKNIKVQFTHS